MGTPFPTSTEDGSFGDILCLVRSYGPGPWTASGPRTNSGAGQTMHPARPVRQKNEPADPGSRVARLLAGGHARRVRAVGRS
jgi:hypothetical protein